MLFGPSFAEEASEHLKLIQTLRQARGANGSNQGFSKAPVLYSAWGAGGQVLHSAMMVAIFQRSKEKWRTTGKEMTRTFKRSHFLNIKRMCKPYGDPPNTSGPQTAQLSNQVAGKLSLFGVWNQLGGVNNRQMGNRDSERFQIPFTS